MRSFPAWARPSRWGMLSQLMGQVLGLFQGDNTRLSQVRELEARHDMQLRIINLISQGGHGSF